MSEVHLYLLGEWLAQVERGPMRPAARIADPPRGLTFVSCSTNFNIKKDKYRGHFANDDTCLLQGGGGAARMVCTVE